MQLLPYVTKFNLNFRTILVLVNQLHATIVHPRVTPRNTIVTNILTNENNIHTMKIHSKQYCASAHSAA